MRKLFFLVTFLVAVFSLNAQIFNESTASGKLYEDTIGIVNSFVITSQPDTNVWVLDVNYTSVQFYTGIPVGGNYVTTKFGDAYSFHIDSVGSPTVGGYTHKIKLSLPYSTPILTFPAGVGNIVKPLGTGLLPYDSQVSDALKARTHNHNLHILDSLLNQAFTGTDDQEQRVSGTNNPSLINEDDTGSGVVIAGTGGISATASGDTIYLDGTAITIDTAVDNQQLSIVGAGPDYDLNIENANSINIQPGGIVSLTRRGTDTLTINATEVDGLTTNELLDDVYMSNDSLVIIEAGTTYKVDLSPYLDNTDNQVFTLTSPDGSTERITISKSSDYFELKEGSRITLTRVGDAITISAIGDGTGTDSQGFNIVDNLNSVDLDLSGTTNDLTLTEGENVTLDVNGREITINADLGSISIIDTAYSSNDTIFFVIGTDTVTTVITDNDQQDLSDGGKVGNNQTIDITDGSSVTFSVADNDNDAANELITLLSFVDDTLSITEAGVTRKVEIISGGGTDDQTVDTFSLSGNILTLELEDDNEPPYTVDLSSLSVDGSDQDSLVSGAISNDSLVLTLSSGQIVSIDLSDFLDNTDEQILDTLELVGTTLRISISGDGVPFETVDLASLVDDADADPANELQEFEVTTTNATTERIALTNKNTYFQLQEGPNITLSRTDSTIVIEAAAASVIDTTFSNQDTLFFVIAGDTSFVLIQDTDTRVNITGDEVETLEDAIDLVFNSDEFDVSIDGAEITIQLADAIDNDNQTVDSLFLNGTNLILALENDGEAPYEVNLSPLQDGTGTDNQNLQNGSFNTGNGELTIGIENGNSDIINLDGRYLQNEVDGDTLNEIQSLSWEGGTRVLTLDNGGGSVTITDSEGTDNQNLLNGSFDTGTGILTMNIEGGSSGTVDLDGRYLQSEVDGDVTNELQELNVTTPSASSKRIAISDVNSYVTLQEGDNIELSGADSTIIISANVSNIVDTTYTSGDSLFLVIAGDTSIVAISDSRVNIIADDVTGNDPNSLTFVNVDFDNSGTPTDPVISFNKTGNWTGTFDGQEGTYYLDNTDDQTIDSFQVISNTLYLSVENDGEAAKEVDLSPYLDDTRLRIENQDAEVIANADALDFSNNFSTTNTGAEVNVDLSNTGVVANTYGNATNVAQIVIDAKGRITSATNVPITDNDTQLTQEQVQDFVGSMFSGSETLITVIYDDDGNVVTFEVNDNLSLYDNSVSQFLQSEVDGDTLNEIQTISLDGSTVTLSDGGGSFNLPADQVDDADADPTNEIQDLNLSGNTLSLTNDPNTGSFSLLPYLDNTDEQILDTLELVGTTLRISIFGDGVPFETVDLSSLQDGVGPTYTDGHGIEVDNTADEINLGFTTKNDAANHVLTSEAGGSETYIAIDDATNGDALIILDASQSTGTGNAYPLRIASHTFNYASTLNDIHTGLSFEQWSDKSLSPDADYSNDVLDWDAGFQLKSQYGSGGSILPTSQLRIWSDYDIGLQPANGQQLYFYNLEDDAADDNNIVLTMSGDAVQKTNLSALDAGSLTVNSSNTSWVDLIHNSTVSPIRFSFDQTTTSIFNYSNITSTSVNLDARDAGTADHLVMWDESDGDSGELDYFEIGTGLGTTNSALINTAPEATTITDGNTINFTLTGTDITGEVLLSQDGGNILELGTDDRLYASGDGYEANTDAQDLSLSGNTLSITNDPTEDVDLFPYLDNTDNQALTVNDVTSNPTVTLSRDDTNSEIQLIGTGNTTVSADGTNITINSVGDGFQANTDETVKVSSNETSAGYLEDQIEFSNTSGTALSINTNNEGANEVLDITLTPANLGFDLNLDGDILSLTHDASTVDLSGYDNDGGITYTDADGEVNAITINHNSGETELTLALGPRLNGIFNLDDTSPNSAIFSFEDPGQDVLLVYDDSDDAIEQTIIGSGLSFDGTTLTATGDNGDLSTITDGGKGVYLRHNGGVPQGEDDIRILPNTRTENVFQFNAGTSTITFDVIDPAADKIMFWDDSNTTADFLEVGAGLQIVNTTLSANLSGSNGVGNSGGAFFLDATQSIGAVNESTYTGQLASGGVVVFDPDLSPLADGEALMTFEDLQDLIDTDTNTDINTIDVIADNTTNTDPIEITFDNTDFEDVGIDGDGNISVGLTTRSVAGNYGSATQSTVVQVNSKGIVTSITETNITDADVNNEGILGVSAGGTSSSTLTTNTSGSNPVTINVQGGLSISETASSNGGSITIDATGVSTSYTADQGLILDGSVFELGEESDGLGTAHITQDRWLNMGTSQTNEVRFSNYTTSIDSTDRVFAPLNFKIETDRGTGQTGISFTGITSTGTTTGLIAYENDLGSGDNQVLILDSGTPATGTTKTAIEIKQELDNLSSTEFEGVMVRRSTDGGANRRGHIGQANAEELAEFSGANYYGGYDGLSYMAYIDSLGVVAEQDFTSISDGGDTDSYLMMPRITAGKDGALYQFFRSGDFHTVNGDEGRLIGRKSIDGGVTWTGTDGTGSYTIIISDDDYAANTAINNVGCGITPTGRIVVTFGLYDNVAFELDFYGHVYSDDQGATWSSIKTTERGSANTGHGTPISTRFAVRPDGTICTVANWRNDSGDRFVRFMESYDNCETWVFGDTIFDYKASLLANQAGSVGSTEPILADFGNGIWGCAFRLNGNTKITNKHYPVMMFSYDYGQTWTDDGDPVNFDDVYAGNHGAGFLQMEGSGVSLGDDGAEDHCQPFIQCMEFEGKKYISVMYYIRDNTSTNPTTGVVERIRMGFIELDKWLMEAKNLDGNFFNPAITGEYIELYATSGSGGGISSDGNPSFILGSGSQPYGIYATGENEGNGSNGPQFIVTEGIARDQILDYIRTHFYDSEEELLRTRVFDREPDGTLYSDLGAFDNAASTDARSRLTGIHVVDMTDADTQAEDDITVNLFNMVSGGVYTIHFTDIPVGGVSLDFPSNFLNPAGTAFDGGSTVDITEGQYYTFYFDGTNAFVK